MVTGSLGCTQPGYLSRPLSILKYSNSFLQLARR